MKEIELRKKSEELERTLQLQWNQLKKDSEVWVKVGGAALALGLISYTVVKASSKKKHKKQLASGKVDQEEIREVYRRKRGSKKPSFFSSLRNRLFLTLLSYGKARFMDELKRRSRA